MPCSDHGYEDSGLEVLRRRNTELAQLLCIACETMDTENTRLPARVQVWWDKHKELDRQQRAAEAENERKHKLKMGALAKLTDEERKLLGIKP